MSKVEGEWVEKNRKIINRKIKIIKAGKIPKKYHENPNIRLNSIFINIL